MKNTLETRLGIFFALALVAAFVLMELVGGTDFLRPAVIARARFNGVQDLKPGDAVKMAGVQIGKVQTIDLTNNRVEVVMRLARGKSLQVRTDSKASIKFLGLMGQNYVALDFGTAGAPAINDGTVLESVEQTDLSTLMAKLEGVASGVEGMTKNFSGENFSNLLGPFTDFLKENNPKLTTILGNLQHISTQIAKGDGTVGKLIYDSALYDSAFSAVTNLNETAGGVRDVIATAKSVVTRVEEGQGTLGKLTRDEALYREATTAVTQLKEVLQKINQGQGSVGRLVNDDSLFKNARMTLQKVDKVADGLEDQGPLTVLGLVAGQLFK